MSDTPEPTRGKQLALLKKYALEYHPDLVLLGFFVGNDFIDAKPKRKRIIVNDIYIDIDKRKELKIFGYPIINQSRLLLFIQQKYKVFQEAQKSQKQSISPYQVQFVINPAEPEKSPGILSLETFLATEKTRLDFCKRQDLQKGVWNGNINYILQSIDEMNRLLEQKNIQFIVAIYPDEFQINPNLLNQIQEKHDLNLANYEINCMQNLLISHLQSQQITYIDFRPRFQSEQKKRPLYLLQEPHWNSAGNQLAAELLFEKLIPKTNQFFKSSSLSPKKN
ncbi:MAG: hypothetical protein RSE13_25420 [Planktothrix sp. GU0601_MAG3]|nr:MAG: hypothetical protein RSE13_25420 [Planktothrix sp. GU0601_MAG3]